MVFYPLDFTFVCPTELTTFSDRHQDFVDIGAVSFLPTRFIHTAPGLIHRAIKAEWKD